MFLPSVNSRIEKHRDRVAFRIDAREVRTLVQIAIDTGQREILQLISAAMLLWSHVFYVQNREWGVVLMKFAVFAPIFRPAAGEGFGGFTDQCDVRS